MDRYEGKPLLRLLECYVLAAIGHLPEDQQEGLQRIAPKLSEIYGHTGTWLEIIHAQMEFPDTLPASIRAEWEGNLERLQALGTAVDPEEFAMAFVDHYFTDDEE